MDSIGSGCPKGTVGFSADPVSFTFTLTPAGFRAQAGGTSQPTDHRRNCQNTVGVAAPEEFTFAIAEADHGGHAHLAPGASGQVSWRHHFQGSGTPGTTWRHSLSGPYSDGWQFTDKIDIASLDFRRCGESRHTYIGLELTVDRGTSDASETSLMLMEPPDGSTFRLVWKRCPKP
ncbi:DUF4360 domain-containing protein [Actinomadura graeca]|uniref:DUF4360 domain-containing protein n=1 Tax=Actinomadura graeca TaxID=2750812 RepID=A0ABX8QYV8_9ACTN|nr:DUF4360 domain-containing protein [Actinomadura graeca]QXJ23374.1 DUF4360 domain-containing protein [Actinomadura graeca]